jgi:hypothetical protein
MQFKQIVLAVSVLTVTAFPLVGHAEEDVGPVRAWFQSIQKNIQDLLGQFTPKSSDRPASSGSILSANRNGDSVTLGYNENAAKSVGDQFNEGFDQIGSAFSHIF